MVVEEAGPVARTGLRILSGPERLECGWWDGDDVRRDYYLVETAQASGAGRSSGGG